MEKLKKLFEPLDGSYLEVREGRGGLQGKKSLLIYKDARVDMNILDEVVGSNNWQRKHYEHKGNLFCSVGIYDQDKKEWVWKEDVGAPGNFEKEKGESSDSFKRACTNWGIGRELYSDAYKNIFVETTGNESTYGWKVTNHVEEINGIKTVVGVGIYDANGKPRHKRKYESKSGWVNIKI